MINYNGAECWICLYREGTIKPKPYPILKALRISKNSTLLPRHRPTLSAEANNSYSLTPLDFAQYLPEFCTFFFVFNALVFTRTIISCFHCCNTPGRSTHTHTPTHTLTGPCNLLSTTQPVIFWKENLIMPLITFTPLPFNAPTAHPTLNVSLLLESR